MSAGGANAEGAARGQTWLSEVMRRMGCPSEVSATFPEAGDASSCWLTITDDAIAERIAGDPPGEVLDALQYLANALLNLGLEPEQQQAYTVELAGYRRQRQSELQALAEDAARRVREGGEEVELSELSSAERRQVHNLLGQHDDLETASRGQEPDRRLVVRLRSS